MSPLPVLMYHAVGSPMPDRLADLTVPPTLLEEQLLALREGGYELLGQTEALAAHAAGRSVVGVTFDDAYADFVEHALGVLARTGAQATLYVPTRHLGGTADWLPEPADRLPLLDSRAVAEVAAEGVEIGSHGAVHVPMDVLAPETAAGHLRESKALLEEVVQGRVASFCYPHGYHSRRLRSQVAAAGYDNACAIGHRLHHPEHDPYAVQRLHVGPAHGAEVLADLVRTGPSGLVPGLKRAATPAWRLARRTALRTRGVTWT